MSVRLKRAYEPPAPSDGYRVLIDRLWPRGVKRESACLDEWARELAPSTELRRWFGHDPARFAEFRQRYLEELSAQEVKLRELRGRARETTLTLVYGARDTEHNDAVVLAELLREARREPSWRLAVREMGLRPDGETTLSRRRSKTSTKRPSSRSQGAS